jgi:hypothetical protein
MSKSKIAVVHNVLFTTQGYLDNAKKIYSDAMDCKAYSHVNIGLAPQLKSRLIEAAFCRTLILCRRDPWNLVERYFHLRPCGKTWYNLNEPNMFSTLDIAIAEAQINQARVDFEDDTFKVFGIVHKFSKNWEIEHNFNKCYAVGMTAVIEPNNNIGVCCDRRGDSRVNLGEFVKLEDIITMWNSQKHWDIMNSINLKDCPRCTYSPHNQIYESFILSDDVCKNFI